MTISMAIVIWILAMICSIPAILGSNIRVSLFVVHHTAPDRALSILYECILSNQIRIISSQNLREFQLLYCWFIRSTFGSTAKSRSASAIRFARNGEPIMQRVSSCSDSLCITHCRWVLLVYFTCSSSTIWCTQQVCPVKCKAPFDRCVYSLVAKL